MASVLQHLQHLTFLELDSFLGTRAPDNKQPYLQQLQLNTVLRDLRLDPNAGEPPGYGWGAKGRFRRPRHDDTLVLNASMLSGARQLTRLQLSKYQFETATLAGKTALQHLDLRKCRVTAGIAGLTQLLSHLQHMPLLTHLGIRGCLYKQPAAQEDAVSDEALWDSKHSWQRDAFAAAYSALTVSSRLQHLDISKAFLPAGVWASILPAGRQLPELRTLKLAKVRQTLAKRHVLYYESVSPLQGARLVSCCPGLQYLDLTGWVCSEQLLAPLAGLRDLRTLLLDCEDPTGVVLEEVCQLTGLRELRFTRTGDSKPGILQLSRLRQLTCLVYDDDDHYFNTPEVCVWACLWLSVGFSALVAFVTVP
jgi:hypothetical protein